MFQSLVNGYLSDTEFSTQIVWEWRTRPAYGNKYFLNLYDSIYKAYYSRNINPIPNLIKLAQYYGNYYSESHPMDCLRMWFKINNLERYAILL